MKEFRLLLNSFTGLTQTLESFITLKKKNELNPNGRLFSLLHPVEEGGLLPTKINSIINEFDNLIIWKVVSGGPSKIEIPEPQRGIDGEFDRANDRVDEIKAELE
jgi:hypothetical protein